MIKSQEGDVSGKHDVPVISIHEDLKSVVETALPLSPVQLGSRLIQAKWGNDIDPQTARLVTLNYNYHGHPVQSGVQQGRVANSQCLAQALVLNYQTVGDGRFGETVFGLYTPPDIGPQVRIVDKVDEFAYEGSGNHETYEGIYRQTDPQTYGPLTQIALRPADFKKWVWELDFKDQYRDYVHQAWPSDEVIVAPQAYPLRTSVKAAFVMAAFLQRRENSLTQDGLEVALRAVGLVPEQRWEHLTVEQLRASIRNPRLVEATRLVLYRYIASDIWSFRHRSSSRILLYIPGNSSPLHYFADAKALRDWIVEQGKDADKKQALATHFAEDDRNDGAFHAGVLTALDGMALYPRQHHLQKGAGFFNDDGYWDPADYIHFEAAPSGTDPFAQLVLTMKQTAQASIETIRDDAQVNRDDLSAVVEPIVQWVNKFGPLALFVPGGEGLLALAGIIDAGYGLNQAINGKQPDDRSAGVTRTVFGLLNALPLLGASAVFKGEGTAEALAVDVTRTGENSGEPGIRPATEEPLLKDDLSPEAVPATPPPSGARTRLELMREIGPSVASFSDEVLEQIGKVSAVDDDMLRLMQAGRPPTPLLADTISRFRIDQDLQRMNLGQQTSVSRGEGFKVRYDALQHSEHEWVRLFQREYPGLPKSAIEQILDRSGVDIQASPTLAEAKRLLRQLDGKASQYEQHVRLNRAYEGLYLQSMENPETDTLVLHSLKALPGWPKAVRFEVLDGSAAGKVLDHVGPINAPICRRLIKLGNRYLHHGLQTDFYEAVLGALSDEERSALQLTSLDPARALRLKISDRPLPRSEFMLGLGRMDSGLTFEAQGLRGGGFPGTPQAEALTHEMMRLQLKEIYPDFSNAEADEVLQRTGAGAQAHIETLKQAFQQLNTDLSGWIDQVSEDVNDMDVPFLMEDDGEAAGLTDEQINEHNAELVENVIAYEHETRSELADELTAIWQKCAPQDHRIYSGEQFVGFKLDMGFEDYHRLPVMNIRFNEVVELSMPNFHVTERESLNGFLECFPNLQTLNLEHVDLSQIDADGVVESVLPTAISSLTRLTSLNLKSTGLVFREETSSQLCELIRLHTLDLSDNPLGVPPVLLGMNDLRRLNLSNTRITRCPIGIMDEPYMISLDLRDNRITRVPPAVMSQAVAQDRVQLWGNPLTDEDTLRRLVSHREQTGINLWLSEPGADYGKPIVWLRDCDEEMQTARQAIWQRLADKASGTRFLSVIDRLSLTADFQVSYLSLQARVWRLLQEADASDEVWSRLSRGMGRFENPLAAFSALEDRASL